MSTDNDAIRLKAINHITYNVKDKVAATKWWFDILGVKEIKKQVDSDNLNWLQVPSGGMIHIIQNEKGASDPSHHGAFEVDDIEQAYEVIKGKGVEPTGPINTRNDGQKAFYVNDPDGNRIEICTKSGFAPVT